MPKTILITGAASGFGRGAALELARRGHDVVAGVQIAPQVTELLAAAAEEGVEMEVMVLDITDEDDREAAFRHDPDVLINNAGIMEGGPAAEIPMSRVRRNFEVNVFGTLAMIQGIAPKMVARGSGKIINVSSMGGLITVPFVSIYTATKHALESITEGLKFELMGTGVEICTINPGAYGTGFNDRGVETMFRWLDPAASLTPSAVFEAFMSGDGLEDQLDPQGLVDALVDLAEAEGSAFRNVVPTDIIPWIKAIQETTWDAGPDTVLFVDPASLA
ncbi:MAG: SDR family oxidoreductase [Actinomycetota bacterium]